MKRNRRNNLIITLSILMVLVVGITIVYAAVSASLKVTTSNVTQNVASWNVGFGPGTVKGSASNYIGSSANSVSCGDATINANSISVGEVKLTKPGDLCTWTVTIKNTGTIAAKLTSIEKKDPSGATCTMSGNAAMYNCGDIRYFLENPVGTKATVQRSARLSVGDIIEPGGSISVSLEAYIPDTITTVSSTTKTQSGFTYTFVWSQN